MNYINLRGLSAGAIGIKNNTDGTSAWLNSFERNGVSELAVTARATGSSLAPLKVVVPEFPSSDITNNSDVDDAGMYVPNIKWIISNLGNILSESGYGNLFVGSPVDKVTFDKLVTIVIGSRDIDDYAAPSLYDRLLTLSTDLHSLEIKYSNMFLQVQNLASLTTTLSGEVRSLRNEVEAVKEHILDENGLIFIAGPIYSE